MIRLVSLSEEKETSVALLLFSALWGHRKMTAICKPGKEPSQKPGQVGTLILDCPAFSTVGNKFLLSHSVCAIFIIAAQTKTSFKATYDVYFN